MTDRPIIFSGPMVRALLEGRKTQTRRLPKIIWKDGANAAFSGWRAERVGLRQWQLIGGMGVGANIKTAYAPGDRLWVREAWRADRCIDHKAPRDMPCGGGGWTSVRYEADGYGPGVLDSGRFRQAMHIPRWASRITLIVTDVRVERLQDISEADAIAEGVPLVHEGNTGDEPFCPTCDGNGVHRAFGSDYGVIEVDCADCITAKQKLQNLWNSLHGPGAWDANPWVAANTFRPVMGNIDQIGGDDDAA